MKLPCISNAQICLQQAGWHDYNDVCTMLLSLFQHGSSRAGLRHGSVGASNRYQRIL